ASGLGSRSARPRCHALHGGENWGNWDGPPHTGPAREHLRPKHIAAIGYGRYSRTVPPRGRDVLVLPTLSREPVDASVGEYAHLYLRGVGTLDLHGGGPVAWAARPCLCFEGIK